MKIRSAVSAYLLAICIASPGLSADIVTDWNTVALDAIRTDRTSPPIASRNLAILHIAIFDAVNGIKEPHERRFHSYLVQEHCRGRASEAAAISAAAYTVLVNLFPEQEEMFDAAYAAALETIPDDRGRNDRIKERGLEWGEDVAMEILTERADDGSDAVVSPPSGSGPGVWQSTPPANAPYLLPQWGMVTPFAMRRPSQFRPAGPPPLSSAEWAADYNEVKALGAAEGSTRTPEQDEIALFWADGAGTETPPGHWNSIAREVAFAQGNTTDENARLFALLNIALADAAICAWDAKYTFNFWRPVTAIRNADTDGNDATTSDSEWRSFIGTPPFPDYTSGHSTFSGAAATVLALFFETHEVAFTTGSDFLPGVFRTFDSFSAAAEEAALSRLYGGIHFRSANEDGLACGLRIGLWTVSHVLEP